mgnify:CR=1 FL=1
MIVRIWRGWTARDNADVFETRVRTHAPTLARSRGFRGMRLLRTDGDAETEFVTLTSFDTLDDVKAFAGEDYAKAVIPEALRALIARVEPAVGHYTVRVDQPDGGTQAGT